MFVFNVFVVSQLDSMEVPETVAVKINKGCSTFPIYRMVASTLSVYL